MYTVCTLKALYIPKNVSPKTLNCVVAEQCEDHLKCDDASLILSSRTKYGWVDCSVRFLS